MTPARVAKIAAKVLAMVMEPGRTGFVEVVYARKGEVKYAHPNVSWGDIRALAASALNRAPEKSDPYGFTLDFKRRVAEVLKEMDVGEGLSLNDARAKLGLAPIPTDSSGRRIDKPKRKRVTGPARIKSKQPSTRPPSAKPPRNGP